MPAMTGQQVICAMLWPPALMDGSGLETQAYRPTVVYLNGEYWGFYNIREKVNEHFLDDKIDVDKSEINLLVANGEVAGGQQRLLQ